MSLAASPQSASRVFRRVVVVLCLLFVVGGIIIYIKAEKAVRGAIVVNLGTSQAPINAEATDVAAVIKLVFSEYRSAAKNWSVAFHGGLLLAAFLSAFAGVVVKFDNLGRIDRWRKDVAAGAAALAAFLITISASLDFQRKWQANRLAAAQVEALAYEVLDPQFGAQDAREIRDALREIALQRNLQIAGQDSRRPYEKKRSGPKEGIEEPTRK